MSSFYFPSSAHPINIKVSYKTSFRSNSYHHNVKHCVEFTFTNGNPKYHFGFSPYKNRRSFVSLNRDSDNQIQFYILGGESSGQGVEKFLDDRCFALSSDSWIGGAGIINIIGNQSPVFILFTPDSMLLRHNTNFTKIKPGINVLPKVTNMSVNPTAKARITIRPTAIPLRGSVRLPSLSPQPQPQTS